MVKSKYIMFGALGIIVLAVLIIWAVNRQGISSNAVSDVPSNLSSSEFGLGQDSLNITNITNATNSTVNSINNSTNKTQSNLTSVSVPGYSARDEMKRRSGGGGSSSSNSNNNNPPVADTNNTNNNQTDVNDTNTTQPGSNDTNFTVPPNNYTNVTNPVNDTNTTIPPINDTNITEPPANDTNTTIPPLNDTNVTIPPTNDTNVTIPPINDTNTTVPPVNDTNTTIEDNYGINRPLYIMLYFGDIDGAVNPSWYSFYQNLSDFYDENQIPAGVSFFPGTMSSDPGFMEPFAQMYNSQYVELIQKGNNANADEAVFDTLSYEQQKEILQLGQANFKNRMQAQLGTDNITLPKTLNLYHGRFTNVSLAASQEIGFNQYFDLFYEDDISYVEPTINYDVIQYGVSFSVNGQVGADTVYKPTSQIIDELNTFTPTYLPVKTISGTLVMPLWAHHEDFENVTDGTIDMVKWNQYQRILLELKNNSNVTFIKPQESYALTHSGVIVIPPVNDTNTTIPPINDTNITEPPANDTNTTIPPTNDTNVTIPPTNDTNVTIPPINDTNTTLPPIDENSTTEIKAEVCTWKGCEKGAVSISVDDFYQSCMMKLEDNGYRGTYFLSNTNNFTDATWAMYDQAFLKGHELGAHTVNHWCIEQTPEAFQEDVQENIEDMMEFTTMRRTDLISLAYPCGFTTDTMQNIVQNTNGWNFLSARGYNFNQLEDATPSNFYNLKSVNSKGYPGGDLQPQDYFELIDAAEEEGKWANLVFHIECDDDNVISYLPQKSIWVAPMGSVVKYISLRDAANLSNTFENSTQIMFSINVDQKLDSIVYKQDLTMRIPLEGFTVSDVEVDGESIPYTIISESGQNFVMFDVWFPIQHEVVVYKN